MNEGKLQSSFTALNVPEPTKETAKNWFMKVATIEDSIVRFYREPIWSSRVTVSLSAQYKRASILAFALSILLLSLLNGLFSFLSLLILIQ